VPFGFSNGRPSASAVGERASGFCGGIRGYYARRQTHFIINWVNTTLSIKRSLSPVAVSRCQLAKGAAEIPRRPTASRVRSSYSIPADSSTIAPSRRSFVLIVVVARARARVASSLSFRPPSRDRADPFVHVAIIIIILVVMSPSFDRGSRCPRLMKGETFRRN